MGELRTILHVDDDDDILHLARMGFEITGGFCVHQCRSGADTLASIGSVNPDLLLLDMMMPDLDGIMLLSKIRMMPAFVNLPAVFMTGSVASGGQGAKDLPGVIGFIIKPFDPLTIAGQLETIWAERGATGT
ncbi:response regulator [Ruegeria profundi]|uniref:response regulator n=1 Tax=Ruegeria profundi TaxID=1685378 RepID=UPI001CD68EC4|nr:response regulator [Ruegeria profundi]MCA0928065.1 response regulator [Ruegeria profundi]